MDRFLKIFKRDKKETVEIKIQDYLKVISENYTKNMEETINDYNQKIWKVDITLEEDNIILEYLNNQFETIKYNGSLLICESTNNEAQATPVDLHTEEYADVELFINKLTHQVQNINIQLNSYQLKGKINGIDTEVILFKQNDKYSFYIKLFNKFNPIYYIENENTILQKQQVNELRKLLIDNNVFLRVDNQNLKDSIIDIYLEADKSFVFVNFNKQSIINQYREKNLFEFYLDLSSDLKHVQFLIKKLKNERTIYYSLNQNQIDQVICNDYNNKLIFGSENTKINKNNDFIEIKQINENEIEVIDQNKVVTKYSFKKRNNYEANL